MTPTPPFFRTNEPLVWIVHLSASFGAPSSSRIVNSAMKSANAWGLNSCPRVVINAELAKFDSLLDHPYCNLEFVH